MESAEENKPKAIQTESNNNLPKVDDRQAILNFTTGIADNNAKTAYERKQDNDKIKFTLYSGRITSVYEEKEALKRIISELRNDLEPMFTEYLQAFGDLMVWTEEQRKAYRKPSPTAKIINTVIYNRFPGGVIHHIHSKNPYIKWCIRRYKNYYFLSEKGILLLEQFIDEATTLMRQCTSLYEFRIKHAEQYGSPDLFRRYFQAI